MSRHSGLDEEARRRTFEHAMELWFEPEIRRRQNTGLASKPFPLIAAQVIIYPDHRPHEVRLNEEVKAIATPHVKVGKSLTPGQPVYEDDVDGISDFTLADTDDPNCGHFTIAIVRGRWFGSFDFRYNKRKCSILLAAAQEFLESAADAAEKGRFRPAIDNLFSAAELAAKAYILTAPMTSDGESKKHGRIRARFNISARYGNIESEQTKAFNDLSEARSKARYVEGDIDGIRDQLPTWQANIGALIASVRAHIS
ncbi:MAG: HEPN domain-containing protein [Verrucomicrobia bacterium]|nr:HEPN domain-containing protein [Verrucomicrobiota bacterium]